MSYTPTTWTTGDTITATALNKIEQGIASAGGGGAPLVVTVTESGADLICDATFNDVKDAMDANESVYFDLTGASDWDNCYSLALGYSNSTYGVTTVVNANMFTFFASSADGYLAYVD